MLKYLDNGFIVAPHRGRPPIPPEGYESLQGDPFVFAPILHDCIHREFKDVHRKCCGGDSRRIYCNYKNEYINRLVCKECQARTPKQLDQS